MVEADSGVRGAKDRARMEGFVCGLIATSHQFACLGVCQLPIPSAPVTLTLVSGDGTPVNLTCMSLMPSGTCVNVPTMSSPVCPNSVAITVGVALSLCVVSSENRFAEEEPAKVRPTRTEHNTARSVRIERDP